MARVAKARELSSELRALGAVLGFLGEDPGKFLRSAPTWWPWAPDGAPALPGLSDAEIETQIAARIDARKAKNFAESDRIRNASGGRGVILEDKPGGVTNWRPEVDGFEVAARSRRHVQKLQVEYAPPRMLTQIML